MIAKAAFRGLFLIMLIGSVQVVLAQQLNPPVAGTTIYARVSFDDCNSAMWYDSLVVTVDSVIADSVYWQLFIFDRDTDEILADNVLLSPLRDTGAVYGLSGVGTVDGMAFCLAPQCSGTIGLPGDPLIFREDTIINQPCIDGTASTRWMISGEFMYQFDSDFKFIAGVDLGRREALVQLETMTDVEDVEDSDFAIFPNPVTDRLTIRFDQGYIDSDPEVTLTSMLGQRSLMTGKVDGDRLSIDVAHLPPGPYVCTIRSSGGVYTQQIVKL